MYITYFTSRAPIHLLAVCTCLHPSGDLCSILQERCVCKFEIKKSTKFASLIRIHQFNFPKWGLPLSSWAANTVDHWQEQREMKKENRLRRQALRVHHWQCIFCPNGKGEILFLQVRHVIFRSVRAKESQQCSRACDLLRMSHQNQGFLVMKDSRGPSLSKADSNFNIECLSFIYHSKNLIIKCTKKRKIIKNELVVLLHYFEIHWEYGNVPDYSLTAHHY